MLLGTTQLWVLLIGSLVPLVTYIVNHVGPQVSEPVKATVVAVAAAAAAALYTAVETSVFGFNNQTLELVLTAVVAAFSAHLLIYKPSGISAKLGGGSNAPKAKTAARRSNV
jgi:uncharacterized membrane protein HdeD (DUF308 family)